MPLKLDQRIGSNSCDADTKTTTARFCTMQEALLIGIPASALPKVTDNATLEELQIARERISGMIASFLSSGL